MMAAYVRLIIKDDSAPSFPRVVDGYQMLCLSFNTGTSGHSNNTWDFCHSSMESLPEGYMQQDTYISAQPYSNLILIFSNSTLC